MNKSLLTNLVSAAILATGLLLGETELAAILTMVGLFALSGALTNWLAVFMLFEKIPFLYGSGVVPAHFEEFKKSIYTLMMEEFFTSDNVERFLNAGSLSAANINLEPVIEKVDLDPTFDGLVEVIMASSFSGMLDMIGGKEALVPLREPFIKQMKKSIIEMTNDDKFIKLLKEEVEQPEIMQDILGKIEQIIEQRLSELTPTIVKEIIQAMIKRHLGWLVIWGGVLGGLIGLISAFVIAW
ncbi:conserved hypothetical protein [Psychromonas ingrahamii 37]|uniref:DUF445 domain-containing protein n=1 Tax=Psychromonas ingrahamii (strain DSM 17664 / CCUG 51855 / 37) TaxID=357804 RepID=A1SUU7_PSYIN|nr:DUF445 family protein [Psychromonas ingrahamii]ABM03262.1 conserved hypothetical protein [Psychromonas ingrahamii 37]